MHLFFDHIFLPAGKITPKRYLISFAVNETFSTRFLVRNLRTSQTTSTIHHVVVLQMTLVVWSSVMTAPMEARLDVQILGKRPHSDFTTESCYPEASLASPASSTPSLSYIHRPLNSTYEFSAGPWGQLANQSAPAHSPLLSPSGQDQPGMVSCFDASRWLSRSRRPPTRPSFTVLMSSHRGFRKHEANPRNRKALVSALDVPLSSVYLAQGNGKRLKVKHFVSLAVVNDRLCLSKGPHSILFFDFSVGLLTEVIC